MSLKQEPLVSIIMPAYNADSYIGEAVASVIDQSYANWELLIIDDGSTDNTQVALSEFSDHRIKQFKLSDNQGVSIARNVGLQNLEGEYYTFLDADDVLPKDSILARLSVFDRHPGLAFVDGSVSTLDVKMQRKLTTWTPDFKGNPHTQLIELTGNCFFGLTWLIKKEYISNTRFREKLTHAEDLLYFIQISNQGGLQYDYIKDEILYKRTGHQSAMKNLMGLENGYKEVLKFLSGTSSIDQTQVNYFKRKVRSIMLKSYLGNMNFYKATKLLFSTW